MLEEGRDIYVMIPGGMIWATLLPEPKYEGLMGLYSSDIGVVVSLFLPCISPEESIAEGAENSYKNYYY